MLRKIEENILLKIIPKLFFAFFVIGILLLGLSLLGIADVLFYAIILIVFSSVAWFVTR